MAKLGQHVKLHVYPPHTHLGIVVNVPDEPGEADTRDVFQYPLLPGEQGHLHRGLPAVGKHPDPEFRSNGWELLEGEGAQTDGGWPPA